MEFTDKDLEPFGKELAAIEIENNLSYKMPLIFRLARLLQENKCVDPALRQLAELCFDEALTNAMVHGNAMDPSKKVRVWLFCDDAQWGAVIEDEGDGFSPEDVPAEGDDEEDDLLRESGRGLLLMDNYLDGLLYNRAGNRLMMTRHREEGEEAPVPEEPVLAAPMEDGMLIFDEEPEIAGVADVPVGEVTAQPGAEAEMAIAAEEEEEAIEAGVARIVKDGDVFVVDVLEERLSDQNVAAFRDAITGVIGEDSLILVDMSRVVYISSVILGAFAAIVKTLRAKGAKMKVCGAQSVVTEVFKSMRFDKLLDLQPDRESGVAKLREG